MRMNRKKWIGKNIHKTFVKNVKAAYIGRDCTHLFLKNGTEVHIWTNDIEIEEVK